MAIETTDNPVQGEMEDSKANSFETEAEVEKSRTLGKASLKSGMGVGKSLIKNIKAPVKVPSAVDSKKLQSLVSKSVFGAEGEPGTTSSEQIDDMKLKKSCCGLAHPESGLRKHYDMMHALILLYFAYIIPKRVGLGTAPTPWQVALDSAIDVLIVVDIVVNFQHFYYDDQNVLITSKMKIRTRYMRTWFFIDLFSVVPFDYVALIVGAAINNDMLIELSASLRLTRMIRFLRLARLPKILNFRQIKTAMAFALKPIGVSSVQIDFVFTIAFLVAVMALTVHLLGCYWAWTGLHETEKYRDGVWSPGGWVWKRYEEELAVFSTADETIDFIQRDTYPYYIDSIYFAIVTVSSVGYGDISATTQSEQQVIIFIIIAGAFLYAFIIGNFSSMIENMDKDQSDFNTKMRGIGELMHFYKIDRELHEQVLEYYQFKFSNNTLFDDHEIMMELPTSLRHQIVLHRFESTIQLVPFLSGVRDDVVVELCLHMKDFPVMPGDRVMTQGAYHKELLILTRGVAMTIPDDMKADRLMPTLRKLSDGELFKKYDTDGDGTISRDELAAMFKELGEKITEDELDACMRVIDGDSDATLDQNEIAKAAEFRASSDLSDFQHEVGTFFGELQFLGVNEQRTDTIEAKVYCEVATLHPEDIGAVLTAHPFLRERLERYAKLRMEIEVMLQNGAGMDEIEVRLKESAEEVQAIQENDGGQSPVAHVEDEHVTVQQQIFELEERLRARIGKVEDEFSRSMEALANMLIEHWDEKDALKPEARGLTKRLNPLSRNPNKR
eukprot:SAG31_NODE_79_length_27235_cov_6.268868_6_plen_782_part_00